MRVNKSARDSAPLSRPMSFRHLQSRREILEAFMREDGHDSLTPILREAADLYVYSRLRHGRDAVRMPEDEEVLEGAHASNGTD